MKRIGQLLLVFALLLNLSIFSSAETPDWTGAYDAVLNEKEALAETQDDGFSFQQWQYLLYDVDKNGVPELIIKLGTCEADYHGEVYTFSDGEARLVCDDLGLGHSSFYSDPNENGVILMQGHMGYAWAERLRLENGALNGEELYEDDLNERLATDPDADYVYPGELIPGSVYLTLFNIDLRLPLYRYEEIAGCLEGRFPSEARRGTYPEGDPDFFQKVMNENREVIAVSADGFTKSPGRIGFQNLLKQDAAAEWMYADLRILSTYLADLNGDGQSECIVDLDQGEGSEPMRFFLSEQDGTVYAYLENYAPSLVSVDWNGNLFCAYYTSSQLSRLFFDREEAMLLTLPEEYLAQ